jgi:hypothetical protein
MAAFGAQWIGREDFFGQRGLSGFPMDLRIWFE